MPLTGRNKNIHEGVFFVANAFHYKLNSCVAKEKIFQKLPMSIRIQNIKKHCIRIAQNIAYGEYWLKLALFL